MTDSEARKEYKEKVLPRKNNILDMIKSKSGSQVINKDIAIDYLAEMIALNMHLMEKLSLAIKKLGERP